MDVDGGVLNATCLVDADCPGGLLCYNNVSWSELESFCACSTRYAKTGEQCGGILGAGAWASLVFTFITLSLRVVVLQWALLDLMRLVCVYGRRLEFNATYTTFFLCIAAMSCGILTSTTYLYETLDVWTEDTVTVSEAGDKEHFVHPFSVVGLAVGQTFTFLMLLNLSVMWVEVSQRAKRVTVVTSKNVSRYRRVSITVATVFSLIQLTLIVVDRVSLATIVLLPFTLSLMVVVFLGRRGMTSVLREAVERTLTTSTSQDSERAGGTRAVLNGIARSSKWMLVLTGTLLLSGFLFAVVLMTGGGWKEVAPIGRISAPSILSTVATTSMMLLQFVTFFYCHDSVRRFFKRRQAQAATMVLTSSAGSKGWSSSVGPSSFEDGPQSSPHQPRTYVAWPPLP